MANYSARIIKLGCAYWLGDNFVRHVYEYHHIPAKPE